jgi:hypothetical protein
VWEGADVGLAGSGEASAGAAVVSGPVILTAISDGRRSF